MATVIATGALAIASLTALFVVLTPRTVYVTEPGQTIWNNQTVWRNTTVYVNKTGNSSGGGHDGGHDGDPTGDGSKVGHCPDVPDWAPAWGVRARCGLPPATGHGHGHEQAKGKGHGGEQ